MQDLKPQRAVKSDSSWHFVGAQCNGADPLDHGQSSPVLFPRAVGVATLTVSLFGVKALRFPVRRSCKLTTSRASAVYRDALSLAAVLAGIGFAGRAVGWILSYSGVALIALWLIWIKGPMAIERLDLATALGIAVYGAFFITMFARPSFGGSLYDRNGYLPFKPPFGPEKWRWDVNATAFTVLVVILLAGLATI
jgi:hypothetical protein